MDGERLIAACLADTKDLQQDMLRLEDEARTLIKQSTCADSTSINSSRRNLFFNADDDRYGGMKGSEEDWIPVAPNYDIMIDALPSGIMSGRGSDLVTADSPLSNMIFSIFFFVAATARVLDLLLVLILLPETREGDQAEEVGRCEGRSRWRCGSQ